MVTVPTSAGDVGVEDLGVVLMHEHVFVRTEALQWGWPGFGGWDEEAGVAAARDRLTWLKRAGVDAIVDMTVPGLGRDPALVTRAAEGTGVRVLFATGLFTTDALPFPFQLRGPGRPLDGDDRLLESLFERDLTEGIGGTGIRAAVLSVVTGPAGLTGDAERLLRAVARVGARTGAVICTQAHAPTRRGLEQLRVLSEHGVSLRRVLIGGCSETTGLEYLETLAEAGAWLGWDGCGQSMDVPLETQLDTLAELCWRGHADRVMLSHDQALFTDHWTEAEVAAALPGWGHASIHGGVLPGLRERGVPDDVIDQIVVRNPRDFLSLGRPAAAPGAAAARPGSPRPEPAPDIRVDRWATTLRDAARPAGPLAWDDRPVPAWRGADGARPNHLALGGLLPEDPDALDGRERELAELHGLAVRAPVLTLCGPGGIGKTRLLHGLLSVLAGEYPDGVYLADLADLRQPELVAARVAGALGIHEENGVPLPDTLAEALRGRRVALALDGCEGLAAACAALCDRLLDGVPGLRVLAASREPLGAAAETVWPVPPLPVPAPGHADPAVAAQSPAVSLLARRAGPCFTLDPAGTPAVTAICRAAGGMPLALELAAARLRSIGPDAIRASLTARLGRPGLPAPAAPAEALTAVLSWTCDLLEPPAQVLLRRLSVFTGWSLEMAERVCADDGLPAARVAGLLAALADVALIAPEPTAAGRARYSMPGAVRDYAAGRLAQAGEADILRRRLRDYIAPLADYVATIGTAQVPATWMVLPEVFRSYDADAANFRAVLAWCLEHGDAETGLRICTALRLCWLVRGTRAEGMWWLDALRDAGGGAVPPSVLGPALAVRAQLALDGGDLDSAAAWGSAGLELSRAAGDSRFSATALDVLARVALRAGQPQDALRYAGEALELTHAPNDRFTRGFALGSRSTALAALGRLAESAEWAQAGLALMQELDNQWGVALFRLGLGDVARALGDLHTARGHYLAALPFVRESMGAPETARCLAHLGRMALRQGDPGPAREYLAESLRLSLACGSRAGIVRALRGFAALALREGRTGRAVKLVAAITALCEAAGLRPPRPERTQRYLDAAADLGADEVARLWAAGLELTSRTAADLALEPPALSAAGRSGA